jgi:hypothetical protein
MPTNFPTSVDNFTNPTANDSLNLPSHSTQHANANDAIEAVEDYLLSAWTNWTPTITSGGGSITSLTITTARYKEIGKTLFLDFDFTVTNNGTGSSSILMSVPSGKSAKNINQAGAGRELATSGFMLQVYLSGTTTIRILRYDNAYPGTTNSQYCGSLTYELN